ncbi:hypothetical protein MHI37_13960 [Paenibacillus sp. FSL H8-0548]|uniref:hypothetical protein n=1 Tax=Paenibacillus sp. FSL H8-0548 TaxID=1920422 RepID=UPI00096FA51A|nr:hypothetical protein [Paenibacillus sp. FSL H8-0548]
MFNLFGISPWSNKERGLGLHFPVIIGIPLLLISGRLLIKYYRGRYVKAGRVVVISSIIFLFIFPWIANGVMLLLHYNQPGIMSLDYSKKNSTCQFSTDMDRGTVHFKCNLTLINYSNRAKGIKIRPVFKENDGEALTLIHIKDNEIVVPPRSNRQYNLNFSGSTDQNISTSGYTVVSGVHFQSEKQKKEVYWK